MRFKNKMLAMMALLSITSFPVYAAPVNSMQPSTSLPAATEQGGNLVATPSNQSAHGALPQAPAQQQPTPPPAYNQPDSGITNTDSPPPSSSSGIEQPEQPEQSTPPQSSPMDPNQTPSVNGR